MPETIKVLHVVGRMDRGGTETLIMNLLRTVDRSRFQFDIVEQTQDCCDYDAEIEALGSKIFRCPHISVRNLKAYRLWWRQFFAEHPEYGIVHGHSRGSAPIYLDEAKRAGRITVAHCHNNSHGKGVRGFVRYVWQLPLRRIADYNFACSYDSGVSQYGKGGKFEVIKNGIPSESFAWDLAVREKVRGELGLDHSFVVGNVARFEPQKNHTLLLKIFKEIKTLRPNAKLMLVGQGTLEQEIRDQAQELGVLPDIVFTGVRSDVNRMYQAMDVFVLPSLFEGLGIVNIEAQTSGLPCFVSSTVAPEAKVTELLQYISLDETPEFWAKQILAGQIPAESRQNQREKIITAGFDIQTTAQRLSEFYMEVLKHE